MKMNMRSLIIVSLVVVGSAATATLAQKMGTEKPPAVSSEFVKVGKYYIRHSAISMVQYDGDSIGLAISGQGGFYDAKDCIELLRVLKIPQSEPANHNAPFKSHGGLGP